MVQPNAWHQHSGQAGHRLPWRSICTQAGLVYRPRSLYTITPEAAERKPRKPFFLSPPGGFCLPRAGCSFPASTAAVSAATAETTSEDRPLTLPPPRSAPGGGSPVGSLATPLDPTGSRGMVCCTKQCTLCYLYSQQSCLYI
jgi:hypothetical protein